MGCSFEEGQNQIITHTFTDNNADYFCDCGHVRFKPGVPNGDQQARLFAESTAREEVLAARVRRLEKTLHWTNIGLQENALLVAEGWAPRQEDLMQFLDSLIAQIRETLNEEGEKK